MCRSASVLLLLLLPVLTGTVWSALRHTYLVHPEPKSTPQLMIPRRKSLISSVCFPTLVTLLLIGVSQQAVANESGLNFISVKGPELLNMVRVHKVI